MTRNKYWILDHFCVNPLNSLPLVSLSQESKKALPKTKTKKNTNAYSAKHLLNECLDTSSKDAV